MVKLWLFFVCESVFRACCLAYFCFWVGVGSRGDWLKVTELAWGVTMAWPKKRDCLLKG